MGKNVQEHHKRGNTPFIHGRMAKNPNQGFGGWGGGRGRTGIQ